MRWACSWLLVFCCGCSTDAAKPSDSGTVTSAVDSGPPPTRTDGGAIPPLACGAHATKTCPSPAPSFKKEVLPLLKAKCGSCHVDEPDHPWPLTDWDTVRDWKAQFTQDILSCTMPPLDAGITLTDEERGLFVAYVACGTPDN
jgi:hypothetical protein